MIILSSVVMAKALTKRYSTHQTALYSKSLATVTATVAIKYCFFENPVDQPQQEYLFNRYHSAMTRCSMLTQVPPAVTATTTTAFLLKLS